jgi:hypothetical protein
VAYVVPMTMQWRGWRVSLEKNVPGNAAASPTETPGESPSGTGMMSAVSEEAGSETSGEVRPEETGDWIVWDGCCGGGGWGGNVVGEY